MQRHFNQKGRTVVNIVMSSINKSNQFCQDILSTKIRRSCSTSNLVMALGSYEGAWSVTDLSRSALYHYQYGSISKSISDLAHNAAQYKQVQQKLQTLCYSYYAPIVASTAAVVLQTDSTPLIKAHSPTLADRGYIAVPNNVITTNQPINVGYDASFVNISEQGTKWSLPLSIARVETKHTASQTAVAQLKQLLCHPDLGLSDKLVCNTLDSKYGNAAYLAPAGEFENLVNIVRLKSSIKVWTQDRREDTGGAPNIYGDKFYLIKQSDTKVYKNPKTKLPVEVDRRSIFDLPTADYQQFEAQTKRGRDLIIKIFRWNDLMLRSKKGNNMKDKPFNLLAIIVEDAKTGERVFKRDMFVSVFGKRKTEITTEQGYKIYRRRYDIEPLFRFAKQRLFLDKFQTSKIQHLDNWFLIVQLTIWLLYVSSDQAKFVPRKWRKYLPANKAIERQARLSIAQTRHAAQNLFLTFDPKPFKPGKSKKGRPRQKGETQIQRTRYKVVKKNNKKKTTKAKIQKIE